VSQKAKILIFSMIFVANGAFCQQKLSFHPGNKRVAGSFMACSKGYDAKPTFVNIKYQDAAGNKLQGFSLLSADHYSSQLGYFCKQEIKFEKATRIPLKFRLGSVQQCDWLEGKPNSTYAK
jgi:hypothetical protein